MQNDDIIVENLTTYLIEFVQVDQLLEQYQNDFIKLMTEASINEYRNFVASKIKEINAFIRRCKYRSWRESGAVASFGALKLKETQSNFSRLTAELYQNLNQNIANAKTKPQADSILTLEIKISSIEQALKPLQAELKTIDFGPAASISDAIASTSFDEIETNSQAIETAKRAEIAARNNKKECENWARDERIKANTTQNESARYKHIILAKLFEKRAALFQKTIDSCIQITNAEKIKSQHRAAQLKNEIFPLNAELIRLKEIRPQLNKLLSQIEAEIKALANRTNYTINRQETKTKIYMSNIFLNSLRLQSITHPEQTLNSLNKYINAAFYGKLPAETKNDCTALLLVRTLAEHRGWHTWGANTQSIKKLHWHNAQAELQQEVQAKQSINATLFAPCNTDNTQNIYAAEPGLT